MASTTPARVGPPAGSELAFDVLSAQVLRQLSEADGLDQKLGVAIAALIAVAGAIYAAQPPRLVGALAAGWLLAGLAQTSNPSGWLPEGSFFHLPAREEGGAAPHCQLGLLKATPKNLHPRRRLFKEGDPLSPLGDMFSVRGLKNHLMRPKRRLGR